MRGMSRRTVTARIGVVASDDAATLRSCLDAVAAQLVPGVEVVVVDQASKDGSAELAISHPAVARVVPMPQGFADRVVDVAGRDADRVVLLGAATAPCPGWLDAALAALERAPVAWGPDRSWLNLALDLRALRSVRLLAGTTSADDVTRRARAAGACVMIAPDMSVGPAPPSSHPVRVPAELPRSRPIPLDRPRAGGTISVVLCTRQRPDHLARCLASLARLEDDDHEVVVVDNDDTPSVDPGVLPPRARLVHERRRGLDIARNRGTAEAQASIVAFIDDDCEADPHWLDALRVAFAHPEVGFVTGRVRPATLAGDPQRWFESYFTFDRGTVRRRFTPWDDLPWYPLWTGSLGTGCNMAFRREHLEAVGGFDELLDMGSSIGGGGDLDIFARLLDLRVVAEYAPDALVWHHHRADRRDLAVQFRGYGQSAGAVLAKAFLDRPGKRSAAVRCYASRFTARLRVARDIRGGAHVLPMRLLVTDGIGQATGVARYLRARGAARAR